MLDNLTQEQRTAARVAGFMYLLLGALASFAEFYVRSGIVVPGDVVGTAHNIIHSERIFRVGIVSDLVGGASNAILAVALYTMLRPVSSALALLATLWRLGESIILGLMTLNSMTILNLLDSSTLADPFPTTQSYQLVSLFLAAQADEFGIGLVYYALGSTLFCYLLVKSRYVPKGLAYWGMLSSFLALICTLAVIVLPSIGGIVPGCYVPVGFFEIVIGGYFLFSRAKGDVPGVVGT